MVFDNLRMLLVVVVYSRTNKTLPIHHALPNCQKKGTKHFFSFFALLKIFLGITGDLESYCDL